MALSGEDILYDFTQQQALHEREDRKDRLLDKRVPIVIRQTGRKHLLIDDRSDSTCWSNQSHVSSATILASAKSEVNTILGE